jgi:predicted glycoside hydrolase/deacetylase ChbG (UPF0249 family)
VPLLIVNADDYGLTTGVSRAILQAHREGIVTSTSVLAVAPAFASTVAWLRDTEGIGIGAHFAVVGEDPPLLSAREIPTLVDRSGHFAASWRQFLPRMAMRRVDPADLRREFSAQLAALQGAGLALTHVDTHQHVHLWPSVARVVLELADEAGIRAMRLTRSASRSPVGRLVRTLSSRLERQAGAAGVRFTAAATGLDEAGHLDLARMGAAVDQLAATGAHTAELGTHPGDADDPERDRYRWGYLWPEELAALVSPATRDRVADAGFVLGNYGDLLAPVP